MIKKSKKRISITLDKELDKILATLCERANQSRSEFITNLLLDLIISIYQNGKTEN